MHMVWYVHVQRANAGPAVAGTGSPDSSGSPRARVGPWAPSSATPSTPTPAGRSIVASEAFDGSSRSSAPVDRLGGHEGRDPERVSSASRQAGSRDRLHRHRRLHVRRRRRTHPLRGPRAGRCSHVLYAGRSPRSRRPRSSRRSSIGSCPSGGSMLRSRCRSRGARTSFAPVLPVDARPGRAGSRISRCATPALATRDLVHVATCIHEGIAEIVSDSGSRLRLRDPPIGPPRSTRRRLGRVTTVRPALDAACAARRSPLGPRRCSAAPARSARATSCSRAAATATPTSRSSRSSRTRPRRASCAGSSPRTAAAATASRSSTSSPARRPAASSSPSRPAASSGSGASSPRRSAATTARPVASSGAASASSPASGSCSSTTS